MLLIIPIRTSARLMVLVTVLVAPLPSVDSAHAESPTDLDGYFWPDVDGQPLPFQDHAEIREALRVADVVSREEIERGIAGTEKLVLEHEGVRFHAAFRSVDVTKRATAASGSARPKKKYRDAAVFESAAYELSELLGIALRCHISHCCVVVARG